MMIKFSENISPEDRIVYYKQKKEQLQNIKDVLGDISVFEKVHNNIKDKIRIDNQIQEINVQIEKIKKGMKKQGLTQVKEVDEEGRNKKLIRKDNF